MNGIVLIGLVLLLGLFGSMDYESAEAAEAHKQETIAAAKAEAKREKLARQMADADFWTWGVK